jgi:hypothetical protein
VRPGLANKRLVGLHFWRSCGAGRGGTEMSWASSSSLESHRPRSVPHVRPLRAGGRTRHDPAPGGYGEGGVEALVSVYRSRVTDRLRLARFSVQAR